jgi:uncharacterized protein YjeT (DUF2065 family)
MRPPVLLVTLLLAAFSAAAPAAAAPWLFVSDIHLKAVSKRSLPSGAGHDTNAALFASAIRAMQRTDPHPPVVVVTGDLLAHGIDRRAATATAVRVARQLGAAFPQAQFVLALGNNDSACGDYALAPNARFLRDVAAAWAPLVNRGGAAPDFARTFVRDGFYTARLPDAGLRAVVIDDVFWSPRYHAGCGAAGNVADAEMNELLAAVQRAPGPVWVLFHIPPGVDAFSTVQVSKGLAIVPFLAPARRDRMLAALESAPGKIVLAVGAHTHRFAYRIAGAAGARPVPMLLVPAISPVYGNAPSFLTANVDARGIPHDVEEYSYRSGAWRDTGGLRELGVTAFTAPQLLAAQARLAHDPQARATFARLYGGGGRPEIEESNWRGYWCAATAFATAPYRACAGTGGISLITGRGVAVLVAGCGVLVAAGALAVWLLRRRVRRA